MEEHIHDEDRHEGEEEWLAQREDPIGEEAHDADEQEESDESSLHHLLHIPALRNEGHFIDSCGIMGKPVSGSAAR